MNVPGIGSSLAASPQTDIMGGRLLPVEVPIFVATSSLDSSSKATTGKNYFHQQVNVAIKACRSFSLVSA